MRQQGQTSGNRRFSKLQVRELETASDRICRAIFEEADYPADPSRSLWGEYPVWCVGTFEQFVDKLEARGLVSGLLFRGRHRRRVWLAKFVRALQASNRVIFYECEGIVVLSEPELLEQELAQGRAYLAAA